MNIRNLNIPWAAVRSLVVLAGLAAGGLTYSQWWPRVHDWVQTTAAAYRPAGGEGDHAGHAHDEHAAHADHAAHAGHADEHSIEVSAQALRNLGLTHDYLRPVEKSTYRRSIRVPAVIVEQPGRTRRQVSTPMTAIVTQVHVTSGQSIAPGQLLFSLRLTHEDLVSAQTDFLKTLGELDVDRKELERLSKVGGGIIPENVVLQRRYDVQKLESRLSADREALKLHGLSDEQVQHIETDRTLLRTLEIYAPATGDHTESDFRLTLEPFEPVSYTPDPMDEPPAAAPGGDAPDEAGALAVLEELRVHQGQAVNAGEALCVLADYRRLYIEGRAFERDAPAIIAARERGWMVTAHLEGSPSEAAIHGLPIEFVANEIDIQARTLRFYIDFQNQLLGPVGDAGDHRFITWKYRPGQRLELSVPVEEWPDQLVLPVDAVAREGAESYVFLQNGKKFNRKPVHVKYRDQTSVVIASDGSLFPGDVVALRGAHQLLMALKNKSGGGVDPHAGHNH